MTITISAMVANVLNARPPEGAGNGVQNIEAAIQTSKTSPARLAGAERARRRLRNTGSRVASITPAIIISAPTGSSVNMRRRDSIEATGKAITSTARPSRNRKWPASVAGSSK
jgi:hypothetical protein